MKIRRLLMPVLALSMTANIADAAEPSGYYSSCEGKSGQALLTALHQVITSHTNVGYNGLWTLYKTSDTYSNGKIWDMYSTKQFTYNSEQCGNYSAVGDCYNREHSLPKSWFNDAAPMYSDAFHIYPTDGKVNGQRSNYPYGECANGTTLAAPNGIKALGKLGSSTFPGYSGKVFEPDDQYKGDFARSYFYMATCYNDRISSWDSDMLAGNKYPVFTSWAKELLLKWHRNDPVSTKETNRNEAVASAQHNRNPFIDHPELVEYIWGDKVGTPWYANQSADPQFITPVDGSTVNIGSTVTGYSRSATINVKATNLTADVTASVTGEGFSVSPTTISKANATSADGYDITVTFNTTREGTATGVLTLTSGTLTQKVNLTASAIAKLPAGPVTAISDNSFVATWSYIGDADARGEYTIDVQANGVSLDEYPCSVKASDESFLVQDLDPETTYTYTVKSQHLTSEPVTVTTLAPIPDITILFDGELNFNALVGEPSEAAELLLQISNITEQVTLSVQAPFQLSTDKSEWATSVTIDPEEDRVYLRLFSETAGRYTTSITAVAGDYTNDDARAEGSVVASLTFFEDFEANAENMGTYSPAPYEGSAARWKFTNAGMWPDQDKSHTGDQAVRMGKNADSAIEMDEDYDGGFGTVTVWTAQYGNDGECTYVLESSNDGGNTWKSAGSATVSSTTYTQQTFTVNVTGPARIRFRQTAGKRWMLDDIEATAYSNLVPDVVADYHRWDAFCRDGQLVIETSEPVSARVFAIDGTMIYSGTVAAGTTVLDVPTALYIIAVDDFARRVLVK